MTDEQGGRGGQKVPWIHCPAACLFVHRDCKPEILVVPRREMVLGYVLCLVELV